MIRFNRSISKIAKNCMKLSTTMTPISKFNKPLYLSPHQAIRNYHSSGKMLETPEPNFIQAKDKGLRSHTMAARLEDMKQYQESVTTPFELHERTPEESMVEHTIKLGSDTQLREHFLMAGGEIRVGRLLEEMDVLAGAVAYSHAEGFHPDRKVTIVTASVDRIELLNPIIPYFDIKLEGKVTYTGRSSMEIKILLSQIQSTSRDGPRVLNMVAYFTMVSRAPYENKSTPVHPLSLVTKEDKRLFNEGEENRKIRIQSMKNSLLVHPPNDEERELLHNLFLTHVNDQSSRFSSISSTNLQNIIIMHPDKSNIHGKVFGGHLLRLAYELAHSTVFIHCGSVPHFKSLDENHFLHPVELGSLCNVKAQIVFTKNDFCVVRCEVEVLNVSTGKNKRTNVFHFTFQSHSGFKREVIPVTYQEGITYLEGRRTYLKGKEFALTRRQHRKD